MREVAPDPQTGFSLERPQEINEFLLLLSSQPIEMFDDLVCLAAKTLVISDSLHQVGRPSIVEEEDALSDAPQRSSSELVRAGATLRDAVGESFAHVMDDGRTTNLVQAIRDHQSLGSEANKVIEHFNRLTTQQQQELIDFLRSL